VLLYAKIHEMIEGGISCTLALLSWPPRPAPRPCAVTVGPGGGDGGPVVHGPTPVLLLLVYGQRASAEAAAAALAAASISREGPKGPLTYPVHMCMCGLLRPLPGPDGPW